ncbi:zinc finger protein, putative [Plasmodium ovale]|uniref:Zinc finger protein, putative n=1 Tax=Plasmodium ovale TaxID=36330 RepID=A0A1C3KRN2_PLAOA|nr:zinc finger protein, putative [Plasmodium ovale]
MSILSLFHICSPLLRTNCLEKKEIYENFICSVCLDLCDTPVVTLCNHICCYKCMYYSLLHKRNCPICKQTVKNNDLRKITGKRKTEYEQLRIRCFLCNEEIKIKNHKKHIKECEYRRCKNYILGCECYDKKNKIKFHEELCEHRLISCSSCSNLFYFKNRICVLSLKERYGLNIRSSYTYYSFYFNLLLNTNFNFFPSISTIYNDIHCDNYISRKINTLKNFQYTIDKLLFKATSNQPVDISSSQQNGDTPSNNISRNGENSIRMNDKMGRSEIGRDKVRRGKNGPGKIGPGKIGPGKIGRGKIGRGKIGRGKIRQSKSDNNISNPVSTINRHWLSTATSRTSVPLSRCAVNSSIHSVRGNHMSYASVGSSCSSDETGKTHRLSTQLAYCYQNRKTCSCISRGGSSRSGNSRSGNSRSGNSRSGNSRSGSIRSGSIRSGSSRSGSIRSGSSRSGESDHCAGSGEEENSSADEFLNILPLRKNFNFKEKNSKDIIVIMEELFQFDNIDMSNIYVDNREFFLCNKNCFTNTIKRLRQELERALILLYFCCCVGMPAMFSLGYISFIMTKGIFKFSFLVTNAFLSLSHRLFLRMFQS